MRPSYSFFQFVKFSLLIFKNILWYKKIFGSISYKAIIKNPLKLDGCQNMYIGKVHIAEHTWLAALPLTDAPICRLIIKDGCIIGHYNHIYATGEIVLENDVLTADKVYISDNLHKYKDITLPIHMQPIKQNGKVVIGEHSWLGENVCILGASIGKHCVIGANSVVTHDLPDYCVAVGSPARIIKRYNANTQKWEKTDKHGNFIEQ